MRLLEEHVNNKNQNFNFWQGYDEKMIAEHPKDGSKGYMIIFVEKDDSEKLVKKHGKNSVRELNLPHVFFYEVSNNFDQQKVLIQKFKTKFNQPFKGIFTI